jgi:hypothetical protein
MKETIAAQGYLENKISHPLEKWDSNTHMLLAAKIVPNGLNRSRGISDLTAFASFVPRKSMVDASEGPSRSWPG